MPIFEFVCRKCSHQFEEILTLAELTAEATACPSCRSANVERCFSLFATSGSTSGGASGGGAAGGVGGGGCGHSHSGFS